MTDERDARERANKLFGTNTDQHKDGVFARVANELTRPEAERAKTLLYDEDAMPRFPDADIVASELMRFEAERDEARVALARSEAAREVAVGALRWYAPPYRRGKFEVRDCVNGRCVMDFADFSGRARAALDAQPEGGLMIPNTQTCPGCACQIDPETCYRGDTIDDRGSAHDGHYPIAAGCECHLMQFCPFPGPVPPREGQK